MRLANDTPEQLKFGLIVLGILGGILAVVGLKELANHHVITGGLLFGVLLLVVSCVAWRLAFY